MSFDNDYPNRKDHRQQYHDSRSFDRSCRNHGGCGWCESRRTYQYRRAIEAADLELRFYYAGLLEPNPRDYNFFDEQLEILELNDIPFVVNYLYPNRSYD